MSLGFEDLTDIELAGWVQTGRDLARKAGHEPYPMHEAIAEMRSRLKMRGLLACPEEPEPVFKLFREFAADEARAAEEARAVERAADCARAAVAARKTAQVRRLISWRRQINLASGRLTRGAIGNEPVPLVHGRVLGEKFRSA